MLNVLFIGDEPCAHSHVAIQCICVDVCRCNSNKNLKTSLRKKNPCEENNGGQRGEGDLGIKGEEGWGLPPGIGSMVYGGNSNDYDDNDDDAYSDDDDVGDTRPLRIVRVNETYVRIIPT